MGGCWVFLSLLRHNYFLDFPSLTKLSKKKERKETRTQRLRSEKTRGFRTTKINPQDYNIQFDLEDYLHKDKIKEIMNLESLEESLEEVLTISGSEMEEMFKCRGASSESPSAAIRFSKNKYFDIKDEDVSESFLVSLETGEKGQRSKKDDLYSAGTEYDTLLAVPHLEHVGTVAEEDMERMMKISQEMLDCNLKQTDLDCLLNVDNFTEKHSPAVSL